MQFLSRDRVLHATFLTLLTGLAWLSIVYVSVGSSWGRQLGHAALLGAQGPPLVVALPLFVAGWLVMSAAMMLPTVWPVLDRFTHATRSQSPRMFLLLMGLFAGGYLVVWGFFGLLAFAGDAVLHRVVETLEAEAAAEALLAPGVLLLAGAYQFSPLKLACLSQCQSPVGFLLRYWRPGLRGAFRLGVRHGFFCLGCCWALMLLMFAVGITNLAWMLGLAVLFYLEKVVAQGMALSRASGVLLMAGGALMLLGLVPSLALQ